MNQYWLNWLTDISLVLVIAIVLGGGVWVLYKLWEWVTSADPWD